MTAPRYDGGSFRDRESRVIREKDRVLRALSPAAVTHWNALQKTKFFPRALDEGRIVGTSRPSYAEAVLAAIPGWADILEHEQIPFVSYPYEWSFTMLQDAAILQLELLLDALGEDFVLKDSSAYNIQWNGARPVFIDIPSFEQLPKGEPWVGYLQFCQLFLFPLMLTSHKNVAFQPWLRGSLDGIPVDAMAGLMSMRDWFRPGVFADVFLQSKLQAKTADSKVAVRHEVGKSGFSRQMIVNNVQRLHKIVSKLRWKLETSEWSDYATDNSYEAADHQAKRDFVEKAASVQKWSRVWDLGSNTGTFSRIAAEHADYTIAMDADPLAIDRFYRQLREEKRTNILPLVSNLTDPSPGLGWRGRERLSVADRGRPELTLALALIHHLVLTGNLPVAEVIAWLADLGGHLVIEFVTKADPMAEKLLLNKIDNYDDYEQKNFEQELARRFEVIEQKTLSSGTRTLYFARVLEA